MKKYLQNQGFTLVELMVVVAITSIISAIAIPNFLKYRSKARTSEAKTQLAAIFTALTAFKADFDTYGSCLGYMGAVGLTDNFYAVGFDSDETTANTIAVSAGAAPVCNDGAFTVDDDYFIANNSVGGVFADGAYLQDAVNTVDSGAFTNGTEFRVEAYGYIGRGNLTPDTSDGWSINQAKILVHEREGF